MHTRISNIKKGPNRAQSNIFPPDSTLTRRNARMSSNPQESGVDIQGLKFYPLEQDKTLLVQSNQKPGVEGREYFSRDTNVDKSLNFTTNDPGSNENSEKESRVLSDKNYELVIQILNKRPEFRREKDIKFLAKCMETVKFFRKYDQVTTEKCLRHMYHKSLEQGEQAFEAGTIGTTFWVILKGSVSIIQTVNEVVGKNENGEDIIEKVPKEVRVETAGSAFGELALLTGKPRAATIVAKEKSDFAVLEKKFFAQILSELEKKFLAAQLEYLSSLKLLETLPEPILQWFYLNTKVTKLTRGQFVYNEGDPCDRIYIIKTGEFKVLKAIEETVEAKFDLPESALKLMKKPTVKKIVEVALLSEKQVFGEEEVLTPQCAGRLYSVVCNSSEAEIYEVVRQHLEKKLLVFPGVKSWLVNYMEEKKAYHNKRLNMVRTARTVNKTEVLPYLDSYSPFKYYYEHGSLEAAKMIEGLGNGINPKYIRRSVDERSHNETKSKIVLTGTERSPNERKVPTVSNHEESLYVKSARRLSSRNISRNESKDRIIEELTNGQINYQKNKLSIMRVSLEMLSSKKRLSRKDSDRYSRCRESIDYSQRRNKEDSSSPKPIEDKTTERSSSPKLVEEKSSNPTPVEKQAFMSIKENKDGVSAAGKDNGLSSALSFYARYLEPKSANASKPGSPQKTRKSVPKCERIVVKKSDSFYRNSICGFSGGNSYKNDFLFESMDDHNISGANSKISGKVVGNSKVLDAKSYQPCQSQNIVPQKAEDVRDTMRDTRSYLLKKLTSRVQKVECKQMQRASTYKEFQGIKEVH